MCCRVNVKYHTYLLDMLLLNRNCMKRCANIGNVTQDVYKALGDTVNQTKLEHMRSQMAAFKDRLEEFAMKHRQAIIPPFPSLSCA